MTKITDLAALTAVVDTDLFTCVDVSDTSMAASGTNKRVTASDLAVYVASEGTIVKITDLTAQTGAGLATADLIETVDISDTTMAASGTNKKLTLANLITFLNANGIGGGLDAEAVMDLLGNPATGLVEGSNVDITYDDTAGTITIAATGGGTIVGTKLTDLTAQTAAGLATTDILETVDISDTTMDASGTNKKLTLTNLVTWLNANGIMVADDSITNAKIAPVPTLTLKGNNTGSTASPTDLTVNQALTMLGAGSTGSLQRFQFSTTTTAPPATQTIRFNNATIASVTQMFVHYTTIDASDIKTRMLARTFGERIYVQDKDASANYANFRLTAAPTDNTTYATLAVAYESGGGSLTDGQDILAGFLVEPKLTSINTQTGTSYTLAASDIFKMVTLSNAAAITVNVPTNATTPFPIGTTIDLVQLGAGQVTVASPGTPTVNATPSRVFRAQYSAATLIKYATDTWLLVGDLA